MAKTKHLDAWGRSTARNRYATGGAAHEKELVDENKLMKLGSVSKRKYYGPETDDEQNDFTPPDYRDTDR